VVAYAMLDADLGTGPAVLELEPNLGLVAGTGPWKGWLRGGAAWLVGQQRVEARAAIDLRLRLSQHRALRLGAELRGRVVQSLLGFHQGW
jgi:hypothetical protein